MNILHKLFGKWEVESQKLTSVTYESVLFNKEWTDTVSLVTEVNSKSGKKRAYLKDIYGNKTKIDLTYFEEK